MVWSCHCHYFECFTFLHYFCDIMSQLLKSPGSPFKFSSSMIQEISLMLYFMLFTVSISLIKHLNCCIAGQCTVTGHCDGWYTGRTFRKLQQRIKHHVPKTIHKTAAHWPALASQSKVSKLKLRFLL